MMIPEAWENHESMDPARAGLLPVPRLAHGALGRPGLGRLHRRHRHRCGARPQRAAAQPVLGHRRRPGGHGFGGRRARHRPVHRGPEGSSAARPDVPGRHRAGPHRRRRRDQDPAGRRAPLPGVARRRSAAHRRPPRPAPHPVPPRRRAPPPAHLRLHLRGAASILMAPMARTGGRSPRLDGHRHAGRRAVGAAAAAVRLLRPALRPGDQPAARRHPRGAGHLASATASGPSRTCSTPVPGSCRQIVLPRPVLDNDELAKLLHANRGPRSGRAQGGRAPRPVPGRGRRPGSAARRWRTCAAGRPRPSPPAPASSCCPTATPTPTWPPSRRCCWWRPCTTTWCASGRGPRSAWWSSPATPARCTTWRCCSGTAPRPSTPTWPSRPSRT